MIYNLFNSTYKVFFISKVVVIGKSLGNFISSQKKRETMLGGMLSVVFECGAEGVAVSEAGVVPLVTHYENRHVNYCVYPLYKYSDELAMGHYVGTVDKKINMEYLSSLSERVLGEFMLMRPLGMEEQ